MGQKTFGTMEPPPKRRKGLPQQQEHVVTYKSTHERIGKGSYSNVFMCSRHPDNGKQYVVKCQRYQGDEDLWREVTQKEVDLLRLCSDCEHIMDLVCVQPAGEAILPFFPWTLRDIVSGDMKAVHVMMLFHQIGTLALPYLQKMRVLHNDIKPENIFVTQVGGGCVRYVLGDFSNSELVDKETGGVAYSPHQVTTRWYRCLQHSLSLDRHYENGVVHSNTPIVVPYDYAVDRASFAMCLHEICTGGRLPFGMPRTNSELLSTIVRVTHRAIPKHLLAHIINEDHMQKILCIEANAMNELIGNGKFDVRADLEFDDLPSCCIDVLNTYINNSLCVV